MSSCVQVICNTFYILDLSMSTIAFGLYQLPSLLNHSCEPNCLVVFNGRLLSLHTIRDVKSGEQVCADAGDNNNIMLL